MIVLLMFVALPLRGYAAVAAKYCESHHGGAPSAHAAGDDRGSAHEHDANGGDRHPMASVCGLCATCSVGASLAPDWARPVAVFHAGADRIPFVGVRTSGHVPEHPVRPPLAL
ncbi:MAG: hypothetical protein HYX46_11545 [Betaproteobacteria bacterium]|nr:hypothetical protein [Betaproteobacteria bacterium]